MTTRPFGGARGVLETLSPEMASDFREIFSLTRLSRVTKSVMDSEACVRTSLGKTKPRDAQRMTTQTGSRALGVLETLSPEMARDLDDAFSLARIGSTQAKAAPRESNGAARGALRFAGRLAVFLLVTVVAVSLTVTVMYLMPLL